MKKQRLIKNITDQIKEAQMKLGFVRESIRLYFPWDSFMVLLGETLEEEGSGIHSEDKLFPADGNCSETERKKQKRRILNELNGSAGFGTGGLGQVSFRESRGRVEVTIPPEGAEYVHREISDPPFLKAVIELFGTSHNPSVDDVCACFAEFSPDYVCCKIQDNDLANQFSRTELLFGEAAMDRLAQCRVAVFGIGGVGGYTAEALARSGIGEIDLIDSDTVSLTNLNRQIIALRSTIGKYKVDVMKERILDINPDIKVHVHKCFYLPETKDEFDFSQYDYVVDAVDTVTAKLQLVEEANAAGVPVISSMGAGNKLDPTAFQVADIYKTSVCPLAKVMRRELKKRGIKKLKVVYSQELPVMPSQEALNSYSEEQSETAPKKRSVPGSVAFVPSVAGLIIAGEVLKDLINF